MEPGRLAPTLTGEELAVDKVLAVFGRAEARDFVDLMALEPRYGLDRLCALAAEKDRGFTPALFAEMLGRFSRLRQEEFGIDAQSTSSSPARSSAGASALSNSPTVASSDKNASRDSAASSSENTS